MVNLVRSTAAQEGASHEKFASYPDQEGCHPFGDFAREHGFPLAVRGGGHNISGRAVCDNGIVIDLSPMKAVHVDAGMRHASIEGGAMEPENPDKRFGIAAGLATV